ncbi:MAG: anaerobic ribonucleoside-triphosphate reductase activating protein [Clostridiaceae bacterium]|nr:anaerobic ribonucleoside-triphosphate reductase activating protein [Clostridiaceae bacterium]
MSNMVRIAGIIGESIVDGPGIRFVVFAQGCKHNCPGCHNPQTHSFIGGKLVSIDSIIEEIKKNPLLDGVTLSGGEPFEQAEVLAELARKVKEMGLNVMTYTGYTFEELISESGKDKGWDKLLCETDILVDGRFEIDKKSLLLKFRGSSNQRIIDVKKSLAEKRPVILEL